MTDERYRRETRTAMYYNWNYKALAVVAVINYWDGELRDWAAYIGCSDQVELEEDCVAEVAEEGQKLAHRDAVHFFPELPPELYRN
jgi:hypothetical protein